MRTILERLSLGYSCIEKYYRQSYEKIHASRRLQGFSWGAGKGGV